MKLKKLLAGGLAIIMAAGLIGCSSGNGGTTGSGNNDTSAQTQDAGSDSDGQDAGTAPAEVSMDVIGNAVSYDPSQEVNNGEDISLEWWLWDGEEMFGKFADAYTAIHPNVTINIVNNPWDDYWTKLPLSMSGGTGPALFNIHNSQHDNLINYLAPYEIDLADLQSDFVGVDAHVINDNIYYIDYGLMTGTFFYNKTMWEAAGLTDADIPETWDEFETVAKALTIKDGDSFQQAGINLNGDFHALMLGMNYQDGVNLLADDGVTAQINSDVMKENTQFLVDLYDVAGAGSKDFGTVADEAFGQGLTAMVFKWGHFYSTLANDYPEIEYGTFQIPVKEAGTPYAYYRYNGESTVGISNALSDEENAVAQDFVRFFLANADLQKELCINYNVFPANNALADDADVLTNPVLSVVAETIDRYVWPGPMPATFENTLQKTIEDILYNGVSVDDGLDAAQETITNDLTTIDFTSVENLYEYAE